jgi:endonuclease/exonuclease/phosphatase family metal-dependent hydrolase
MRGLGSLGRKSVYFADCFMVAGSGPSATFSPQTNAFAWHSLEPERRIDYIYVRGPDATGRGKPLSARRCFDTEVDSVLPSDHYGVVAELSTSLEEIPR